MEITSNKWTLPTSSKEDFKSALDYARSKNVPIDDCHENHYDPKREVFGIWYASKDGLHACIVTNKVIISRAEFEEMCDSYTL